MYRIQIYFILIILLLGNIFVLGQDKKMILPDQTPVKIVTNKGSDIRSSQKTGTISPHAITSDWGVVLRNISAFHHTSQISKEEFLIRKNEANKVRENQHKGPFHFDNKMDSIIPYLHKNFRGNLRGNSVPMDNSVAVSRNGFIVSAINTNVIFAQPDGVVTFTKSLSDFFFLLNLGTRMYDPRVVYDTEQNKFIFMCLHGSDPQSTELCIAFSNTEDPNGEWHYYKIDGNPGDVNNWFDYPNITVSSHDFYISGLMRNVPGDWQYSVLYQIDKMDGFEGKPLRWKHYNELFDADESPSFNIVPTPNGWSDLIGPGMYFVSNEALGGQKYNLYYTDESLHNNPVLNALQTTGLPTLLAPDGRQKGTTERLNTFDSRLWSALYLNGTIHIGSHVNTPSGNVGLFYGRLNIADFSVQADILETDSIDYGFPSFSAFGNSAESDTILVNYLYTGPGFFPGQQQRICFGRDSSFIWGEPNTLKEGISIVSVLEDDRERWGDYTTSGRRFTGNRVETWVTGCFGEGASYGTWLGQYINSRDIDNDFIPDFTADKTTVEKNNPINFTDISKIEADEIEWKFQNGNPESSNVKNPEVTWAEDGAYDVTMIIKKGERSDSLTKTQFIHIMDAETVPVANFTYDKDTIFRNDTVQFFNQSSPNTTILKWTFTQGAPGASNEENPRVRYPLKGSYTVNLTAVNIAGINSKTVTKAITVLDRFAPNADFTASRTQIMPGDSIQFSDISTGGPTSWEWIFEGGDPEQSTTKNPLVTYTQEGTFSVTLKVKNNLGENEITKTGWITVGQSSTKDESDFEILKVYPNPIFEGERITFHIHVKQSGIMMFDILDNNGRVIKKLLGDKIKAGENIFQFNTTHLTQGTYFLRIKDTMGSERVMPFLVF